MYIERTQSTVQINALTLMPNCPKVCYKIITLSTSANSEVLLKFLNNLMAFLFVKAKCEQECQYFLKIHKNKNINMNLRIIHIILGELWRNG